MGAVFGTLIVIAVLALVVGVTPYLLIPIVVIAFGALAVTPLVAAFHNSRLRPTGGPGPSGVPSTREASYDPAGETVKHRDE